MGHHLRKDEATNTSRAVPEGTPGARRAVLECRVLDERDGLSLCQIDLVTGRSHQIRVQMAAAGCPLWGDRRYNPSSRSGQSVALWACEIALIHPTAKREMRFSAPAPRGEPWDLFVGTAR
jgi:23S rRNA pseudouridine1911/1915/1917 synthase